MTERLNLLPLLLGVRLRDARRFIDASDLHLVMELRFAFVYDAADRRGRARLGCAGKGDMPFAGHQAAGRVEANPPGTRQIHFAPSVQVGEVNGSSAWAIQRFHVGRELDEVAADKARGQTKMAQQLNQQPPRVPAGTAEPRERLFGGLN